MAHKTQRNKIEEYFEWWMNEMMDYGYIKKWYREPETLIAHETIEYGRYKRFKTKEKIIEKFNLFREVVYTYDYRIVWDESAEFLFYEEINNQNVFQFGKPLFIANRTLDDTVFSDIDVKPTTSVSQKGGKVSSSISFPFKQRMIWKMYRRYITKVVPIPMAGTGYSSALFITSFTPTRYLLTDGGRQARKIRWMDQVKTIELYTLRKKNEIELLLKTTRNDTIKKDPKLF